ncbi:HEAT repeat domain-containing protein [Spongiimicrobium salis]|uniref:HEAT repeat domain-containing protein n=1 Tax=Spongiimicrobium salis TaxID=1667022 RepID=UPI00374D9E8B
MKIAHSTYYNYLWITAPKIDTDILWAITLISTVLGILCFMIIFFFRNKLSAKSKKTATRKTELAPIVSEFLFYEEDASKEEKSNYVQLKIQIRESLKDNFNREVLSEVLLDLQKDVSGDTRKRLYKLYKDLGLHLDAFQKLKSWRWEVVSSGILELTQMKVEESYTFITKFVNDKRSVIRKQAEIATVTLKHEGINYFLDTTKYTISEWQQLKLLDVLRNQEDFQAPKFKVWLTSKNKDVVLFALRLIKYYNQSDANASIIHLVRHKNNEIKAEAIHCIKEFCVFEALDTLKQVFKKCNADIKLLILDAIAELGDHDQIPFLKAVEQKESNFLVKSKALNAINTISPESVMPTDNIEEIIPTPMDNNEMPNTKEEQHMEIFEKEEQGPIKETMDDIIDEFQAWPPPAEDGNDTINIDFLPIVSEEILQPAQEHGEEPIKYANEEDNKETLKEALLEDSTLDASLVDFLQAIVEEPQGLFAEKTAITTGEDIEGELSQDTTAMASEELEELLPFEIEKVKELEESGNITEKIEEEENDEKETLKAQKEMPKSVFDHDYFNQDEYNKTLLLDTIEQFGDQREVPLLISIVEKETNGSIKNNAFEILNKISDKKYWLTQDRSGVVENSECREESVFRKLFWVSDEESQLLLLDEMLTVGDHKEICFLETLSNCPNDCIRKKAQTVAIALKTRIEATETVEETSLNINKAESNFLEALLEEKIPDLDDEKLAETSDMKINEEETTSSSFDKYKGVMPLEFCFLLDELEIRPSKTLDLFDTEIDFENAVPQLQQDTPNTGPTTDRDEEDSFLKQLLSSPSKRKND